MNVSQIWHDSPEWTRPGRSRTFYPADLRDVYKFARAASGHYANEIRAWEVWNEPDIDFWPLELSDKLAGVQKSAYLGLKDGNPNAIVTNAALVKGDTPFFRNFYACGTAEYSDIFNWHCYKTPADYKKILASHLALLQKHGAEARPIWLTEAGLRIKGDDGPGNRLLGLDSQKVQCRYIPKSVVMSLAAGSDRHFFFVLPDYLEEGLQFGLLKPDITPYPGFVALSAAANILGQAEYLGEYKIAQSPNVAAYGFATPRGVVLSIWAEQEAEVSLPISKPSVIVADIFGDETNVPTVGGNASLKVGSDVTYVFMPGNAKSYEFTGNPRPAGRIAANKPSRAVVVGYCNLPIDKAADAYRLSDASGFKYTVEVYNFDEHTPMSGQVEVAVPDGWRIDRSEEKVALDPMERRVLTFDVVPQIGAGAQVISVSASIGERRIPSSVSTFLMPKDKVN